MVGQRYYTRHYFSLSPNGMYINIRRSCRVICIDTEQPSTGPIGATAPHTHQGHCYTGASSADVDLSRLLESFGPSWVVETGLGREVGNKQTITNLLSCILHLWSESLKSSNTE